MVNPASGKLMPYIPYFLHAREIVSDVTVRFVRAPLAGTTAALTAADTAGAIVLRRSPTHVASSAAPVRIVSRSIGYGDV